MVTGTRRSQLWRRRTRVFVLTLMAVIGGWLLSLWLVPGGEGKVGSEPGLRRPNGQAQLVSIQPLPEMEGEECPFVPASASTNLFAVMQERTPSTANLDPVGKRKPSRMIKDGYSSYSSVAVDLKNDEVVMTDESQFNILSYSRTENTPPGATMSEPKRIIGGKNTWIEYDCSVYIDQNTGDIYAVNNDTVHKLVVFSRTAKGNVAPDRIINTPHSTYGIAVDEPHQELFLAIQDAAAVSVFHKMAKDDDPPFRLITGEKTLLADPHGIAVDSKTELLFVANWGAVADHEYTGKLNAFDSDKPNWPRFQADAVPGTGRFTGASITVYPRDAQGDVAPSRIIKGPKTELSWPTALSIDPERGEIFVANDTGDSILVFSENAEGDAAPTRVIKGPKSLVKGPTGVFFDAKHDELWVSNFGNHTAAVYKATASGDVAPLRVIRSGPAGIGTPNIGNAFSAAYDSKRDQIIVPN